MARLLMSAEDYAARASREEMAAEQSLSPEARLAHQELARLCHEQATKLRRGNRGPGVAAG